MLGALQAQAVAAGRGSHLEGGVQAHWAPCREGKSAARLACRLLGIVPKVNGWTQTAAHKLASRVCVWGGVQCVCVCVCVGGGGGGEEVLGRQQPLQCLPAAEVTEVAVLQPRMLPAAAAMSARAQPEPPPLSCARSGCAGPATGLGSSWGPERSEA